MSKREKGSFEFAVKEYSTRRHSTAEPTKKRPRIEDGGSRIANRAEQRFGTEPTKHTKENIFSKIRCPLRYPIFVSFALLSLEVFAACANFFGCPSA